MAILSSLADDLRADVISKIKTATQNAENPDEGTFQDSAKEILKQSLILYVLSDKRIFGE